ncbi:MAG TPA: tetratricopeptide repeat-containing sensor histidine kinase [Puia sp.]|nr:tetratricopeptide repeat-containing sensor histidine kinase [Puia sp.]
MLISVIALFSFACSSQHNNDSHPEYFVPVLKKVDTIQYAKKDEALAYLDSVFYAFPNPGVGDIFSYDSIKCDQISFAKHDYYKAMSYADSMIALSEGKMNDEVMAKRYSWALYAKGDCFRHLKRYDEALRYYLSAQQIVLNYAKDKCNIAKYDGNIALLMFAQEKYQLAASYFLKQHNDFQNSCKQGDYRNVMDLEASFNNAALSYLKAGMLDSAWHFQNEAIKVIEENEPGFPDRHANSTYAKAVIYGDQAEVLSRKGRFAEAEDLYKKSIEGSIAADLPYAQSTLARLAELYLNQGNKKLLKETLVKLKHSLDTLSDETQFMKWLNLKTKYFVSNNQIDSAFIFQKRYDDLKDSVDLRDKKFATEDVGKTFENLELKYSNEVLQKEGKLKNLYLAISILVFIMAASIAVLIWYNLRRAKKLNLQVQQKNKELEKAFNSLEQSHAENTRIMRIVAHDLKNPISAIQNIMHALLQKEKLESQREMFAAIQASCNDSMSLIRDLLEERKEQLKKTKELIEVGNLLESCVQLLQAKADEKKQKLKLQAEHFEMMINRQKIWRVMSNVINNAIKFSPAKSLIDIRLSKTGDKALLSITDNGIGIPEKLKDKIFDLSEEAIRPGTDGEKSYGLGLSISKKIVEEHQGKLWFESTEGEGSVFYVELPLA